MTLHIFSVICTFCEFTQADLKDWIFFTQARIRHSNEFFVETLPQTVLERGTLVTDYIPALSYRVSFEYLVGSSLFPRVVTFASSVEKQGLQSFRYLTAHCSLSVSSGSGDLRSARPFHPTALSEFLLLPIVFHWLLPAFDSFGNDLPFPWIIYHTFTLSLPLPQVMTFCQSLRFSAGVARFC